MILIELFSFDPRVLLSCSNEAFKEKVNQISRLVLEHPDLGSLDLLEVGSENFLKIMSSLLTTMDTRQEAHSHSPSGHEAASGLTCLEEEKISSGHCFKKI